PASQLSFNGAFTPNTFLTLYHNHISNTEETKKTWDNGIMGGYIQRTPSWYWALSGGVCYYRLESFLNWHYRESTGVGIPLQAQLFWTPFRHFGFGLIGHAVVSKDPLSTVFLGVQVLG
ncbi:MAG TPA: hypothetical protein VJ205_03985, partial [Gammaproteobacteria bacterium]|nr:hypothetical protein [Gammaproteobacteria bacterium]